MKREFKPSGNSKYAKRYQKRMEIAKSVEGGFYQNTKGKRCPMALPVLNAMS